MRLRVPPGRMGRVWLAERRRIAARGAEVLEQKVRVLVEEERRLRHLVEKSREAWEASCLEARRWLLRAALLGGERQLVLVAAHLEGPLEVEVRWRGHMGVTYPAETQCRMPAAVPAATLGDSAALGLAARAFRDAADRAVRHAATRYAHEVMTRELDVTRRRLRAIERRWIPALEAAARDLGLRLDEVEREDTVRVRWVATRRTAPPGADE